jgi:hypothetical protein
MKQRKTTKRMNDCMGTPNSSLSEAELEDLERIGDAIIAVMAKEGGFDVQRFVELEDYTREAGQILAQRDVNTEVDDEDDEFPFGTHCEQCIEALLTPKECADKWMKKQRWAELSRHSGRSARRRTLRC